jgi:hypothetical protein
MTFQRLASPWNNEDVFIFSLGLTHEALHHLKVIYLSAIEITEAADK